MPRSRLVWLQIADQQYHDLPDSVRDVVDRRLAQLMENPTADPDAVTTQLGSVECPAGRQRVPVLRRRTRPGHRDRPAADQLRVGRDRRGCQ